MSKAENVLFFDVIFALLLASYGVGIGTVGFTALPPPPVFHEPSPLPPACAWWDLQCQAIETIVRATAFIGWALLNIFSVIGYGIAYFVTFFSIAFQLTFSSQMSANGVPWLGFLFTGLQIYVVFELFRILRGSSTGV